MDEREALQILERELDSALGGITAPPTFAASVRSRIPAARIRSLPEILDGVGWVSVLFALFVLLACFAPIDRNAYWFWAMAAAILTPAFWFAWKSLRAISD